LLPDPYRDRAFFPRGFAAGAEKEIKKIKENEV
jgi:hypothetical protein